MLSETTDFSTQSTSFVNIPGATQGFNMSSLVGCVKVRFHTSARCSVTSASDICSIRALVDGTQALPGRIQFAAENNRNVAYSFQWFTEVSQGNHTVRVQAAVGNAATLFQLTAWSMDVEITD